MHTRADQQVNGSGRSLADAVSAISERVSSILRLEVELAMVEVKGKAAKMVKGLVLLAAAGVLAFAGFSFGLVTLILAATASTAWWLTMLVITAVLFLASAVSALSGIASLKKGVPVPKQAIQEAKLTQEALRGD